MLWTICVVLFILWLLGFSMHVGGGLIHLLLVVGLVMLVINLVSGRRTTVLRSRIEIPMGSLGRPLKAPRGGLPPAPAIWRRRRALALEIPARNPFGFLGGCSILISNPLSLRYYFGRSPLPKTTDQCCTGQRC